MTTNSSKFLSPKDKNIFKDFRISMAFLLQRASQLCWHKTNSHARNPTEDISDGRLNPATDMNELPTAYRCESHHASDIINISLQLFNDSIIQGSWINILMSLANFSGFEDLIPKQQIIFWWQILTFLVSNIVSYSKICTLWIRTSSIFKDSDKILSIHEKSGEI